ncbi:CyaF5 adenylate cyclase [Leisingera sp. ANG-M1]|uniref:adenylate/guanylate cyclase domain-containing protein n=1 Tax=Leisingera sp. ANG-M1 TaxID=1577895 RepID=UPI00057E208E|nr:adenylate/guanylate cyclase domain-containing protein [Leisingera sp. ANG-M1]KIC12025.1 CyaF5 adenylate cyclase [Leisingera sp. ANG-M1]
MPDKPQRRLAAIFVLDVSGFSRMMAEDEAGTLNQVLAQQQSLIAPAIRAHQGRIVKLMGDGVLAVFPSVISAVEAAAEIQAGAARGRHLKLRIGINLGEVIIAQGDVYGDEVNIAARLEALAPVGGVALSAAAYSQVRNRIPYRFDDLGLHEVKNIPEPVQAYALGEELTSLPSLSQAAPQARPEPGGGAKRSVRGVWIAAAACAALAAAGGGWWLAGQPGFRDSQPEMPLPAVEAARLPPLIAVLPFTTGSGPPELGHALSGEVIRALSSIPGLAVVAPDSSLAAAGLPPERAAELLGAEYVISGHLPGPPLQGIRLQIHGGSGRAGLPARPQTSLPKLTAAAAADILVYFGQPLPSGRAVLVPDQALMQLLVARSKLAEGERGAAGLALQQALLLEPGLAEARVLQAMLELDFLTGPLAGLPQRAVRAAQRLEGLPAAPGVLRIRALAAQFGGRPGAALDHARMLQQEYPNDADGHLLRAWLLHLAGQGAAGEAAYATARRLNPVLPARYRSLRAAMLFASGRDEAAAAAAGLALEMEPRAQLALAVRCAGLSGLGRFDEAGRPCAQLAAAGLTLEQAAGAFPHGAAAAQQRLRTGLSLAGLPGQR